MNIYKAVKKVLDSGWFILGDEVKAFEKEVAKIYKKKYAIGVNSGTDALWLSAVACGVGENDKVITTPFTFISPAEVIAQTGADPAFVDIDPETFLIDPNKIEAFLKEDVKNTNVDYIPPKAIIPVHLFGKNCDKKIKKIAKKWGIKYIIEDAAQAFGNMDIGWGDLLCFSFHPAKSLGACGDAGMILTDNKKLAEKIMSLRNHGADLKMGAVGKYHNLSIGFNSRLDEIQAAILREKLKTFFKEPIKRLFTFRTPNRDLVQKYLNDKCLVDNKIFYNRPLHLLPCFKYLGYKKGDFPVAEKVGKEVLSVNIYE